MQAGNFTLKGKINNGADYQRYDVSNCKHFSSV